MKIKKKAEEDKVHVNSMLFDIGRQSEVFLDAFHKTRNLTQQHKFLNATHINIDMENKVMNNIQKKDYRRTQKIKFYEDQI